MSFEKLLNITCTIQSKTATQSATGAKSFTWANKATSVKTAKKPVASSARRYNEVLKIYEDQYYFYFLPAQSITVSDRIIVGSDTYTIESVDTDSRGHHKQVLATKLYQA